MRKDATEKLSVTPTRTWPSGPSGIAGDVDIPLRSNVVVLKSANERHTYFGCTICNRRIRVDKQDKIGGIVAFQELHANGRGQCPPSRIAAPSRQSTMDEFVAPVDLSPARAQPEAVEGVRLAAEFERDRASAEVHRLLAMTVGGTSCLAEASVEVTDFRSVLVELGPGFFGTGQTHTSGCHWARCAPHTVPLGLRDARRLCPEDGAIYENVRDGFEILRRRGVRDVVGLVAPPGSDSGYEAAVRDRHQQGGSGAGDQAVALDHREARRAAEQQMADRACAPRDEMPSGPQGGEGHSQVIFDEPSSPRTSDSDDE
jgi:hypothetical protein